MEGGQERRDRHRERREDVVQVLNVRSELLRASIGDVVDSTQLLHEQSSGTLGNLIHVSTYENQNWIVQTSIQELCYELR